MRTRRDRYRYLKAYRAELARVGLCISACGREATRGGRCEPCYQQVRVSVTASYRRRTARGRCASCPRRARPGRRRCSACARVQAMAAERRRLNQKYSAADAAAKLDLLTARRAVD